MLISECFKPTGWLPLCKCSYHGHFQAIGAKLMNVDLGRDLQSALWSPDEQTPLHHWLMSQPHTLQA